MGDRVLIILHTADRSEYSPVIYGHWCGDQAGKYIRELKELMDKRTDDLAYATARLIGIMHTHNEGNLSLGAWNLPADFKDEAEYLKKMSHGDAGVILVDVKDFSFRTVGGYEQRAA